MNRAFLERRLALAQRHADTAEDLLDRQLDLVRTLSPRSKGLTQARRLLRLLEELHRLCRDNEHWAGIQLATMKLNRLRAH